MLSNIINRFSSNTKPKPLFLGRIVVNPRSQLKAFIEDSVDSPSPPTALQNWIATYLEIPSINDASDPIETALLLDIAVMKYQAGTDAMLQVDFLLPLLWRPSIWLKVRLREYPSDKILGEHSVKKIMPWRQFLGKAFSYKAIFISNLNYQDDLKQLLGLALLDALAWAKRKK